MENIEVLAPAGDREKLEAAVLYGAHAVYLAAQQFGMRASAKNFSLDQLREAVDFCHDKGVKVYLTCNVLLNNNEVPQLEKALLDWQEAGVDALIISDVGVLGLARKVVPQMELHVSTQAGITNYLTANQLYEMGAKRVVLARELSLEDIKVIRDNTPKELELEAFVHGAMCMSFSGRCLISQYMTGRDANHGECAQPCRWKYHLVEEKRQGEYYPIVEDDGGTYFFNAKDLCMLDYLDRVAAAGVTSFKIEGRAKSSFYAAAATNAYRTAADILTVNPENFVLPQWLKEEPYKMSHREYTTGFFFGKEAAQQVYDSAGYIREWEIAGEVMGYENGYLLCRQRNKFFVGDLLEILLPSSEPIEYTVTEIINSQEESVEAAPHPMEMLKMPYPKPLLTGALIRRKTL